MTCPYCSPKLSRGGGGGGHAYNRFVLGIMVCISALVPWPRPLVSEHGRVPRPPVYKEAVFSQRCCIKIMLLTNTKACL